jgi:DNA polymerase I-like protein with 3'-5' exonuclease and polymerase domains
MLLSLDTESTGLDLRHGARPFLVTFCNEEYENIWFEWNVDPLTRKVCTPKDDLEEIQSIISSADRLVLQNTKYDVTGLTLAFKDQGIELDWPWHSTVDTLLAGHLLASNHPHTLESMAVEYVLKNITKYERKIESAVKKARSWARSNCPEWRIANKDLAEMPSAKEKVWKNDMWLPRAVTKYRGEDPDNTTELCTEYANIDSTVTLAIWLVQERLIKHRGLWEIYLERLKLLPIIYSMEQRGITLSKKRLEALLQDYKVESSKAGNICESIAKDYGAELTLPKSGNNKSLRTTVFDYLKLPPIKHSKKTGEPSLDKDTLEYWKESLEGDKALFVKSLSAKRSRDTAMLYMEGYKRFWIPLEEDSWYRLHPNLNSTGTDTLRCSSNNPNEQNISKKEGFNLRYCFGPAPGREWWSLDAQNIELRIPAFESGEKELIEIFENPDKPPYYGSYHLVIADLLHPKLFKEYGIKFKEEFESTWYQWLKNGSFAVIYGCQEAKADITYHVQGAYRKIRHRFPRIAALSDKQIKIAGERGYIETIPDRNVCKERGYPLLCSRSQWGGVKPTIPLNYHIQGTACWWMMKAMIRCQPVLDKWTARYKKGYYMVMQIHDELVFDFPKHKSYNLSKMREIKHLMEQGGDDIGVPTPVGVKYHSNSWDKGVTVCKTDKAVESVTTYMNSKTRRKVRTQHSVVDTHRK